MKIAPIISDKIYLRDLASRFKDLEGDVAEDEAVYVIIRQATEGDVRRVAGMFSERTVQYLPDGSQIETFNDDTSDARMMQVYTTLAGCGNLYDASGKPYFSFEDSKGYPKLDMTFDEFREKYLGLPSALTAALVLAVWENNPQWDIRLWANPQKGDA